MHNCIVAGTQPQAVGIIIIIINNIINIINITITIITIITIIIRCRTGERMCTMPSLPPFG